MDFGKMDFGKMGFNMMDPKDEYKESQISNILLCPDCKENPPNLVEEFSSGDMVCATCGLVVCDALLLRMILAKH